MNQRRAEKLRRSVGEILFHEWDPIGINANPQCRDEYDSYVPTICRYLLEGADEYELMAHLARLERDAMGLSFIDFERNQRVVRRLHDSVRDKLS